jgi:hypothetical protein
VGSFELPNPGTIVLVIEGLPVNPAEVFLIPTLRTLEKSSKDRKLRASKATSAKIKERNSSHILASFDTSDMILGEHRLYLNFVNKGLAGFDPSRTREIIVKGKIALVNKVVSSLAGGAKLSFTGHGFSSIKSLNSVKVCGMPCVVDFVNSTALSCKTPVYLSFETRNKYNIKVNESQGISYFADDMTHVSDVLADSNTTSYYASKKPNCFITYDAGKDLAVEVQRVRIFPNIDGHYKKIEDFDSLVLEASNDGNVFDQLFAYDKKVMEGWNDFIPRLDNIAKNKMYRYIRIRDTKAQSSYCNITEFHVEGLRYAPKLNSSLDSVQCDTEIDVNGFKTIINNTVNYREIVTPVILSINPWYGPVKGGTELKIVGSNFGNSSEELSVRIDNVKCEIKEVNDTLIICVTGKRR